MNSKIKKIFIILVGIILIFLGVIYLLISIPSEKEKQNTTMSTEKMVNLLKYAPYDLTKSDTLTTGSITEDSMISFATDYMMVNGEFTSYLNFDDDNNVTIVNKEKLEQVVFLLFNKKINYNNVSYNIDGLNIFVPNKINGGDMQVYKYNKEEYDTNSDTYLIYIDVLETGSNRLVKLTDPSVTDYDEAEVIYTMIFKYKIVDGRKIILAFNTISNW